MNPAASEPSLLRYALPFAIILVVLVFRMRRMSRERPLKIGLLWIVPALYLVVAGFAFVRFPPHGLGWVYSVLGLTAGAALGWQRGRLMQIRVDPETHAIWQKGSWAAMAFILVLILVRSGARSAAQFGGPAMHIDVMMVTDILIAFALGLLTAQRVEMFLRARRLLEAARAPA
ncbi:hypothetical protein AB2M62_12795 [Sphingomonas sp. MMS12-HWE2-04]|uniref:hypothetical protein n=1 Tax=Sphingomonas sp. MMS12-HWE2-04 TaxID=3234199 RepID=UPI00384E34D8